MGVILSNSMKRSRSRSMVKAMAKKRKANLKRYGGVGVIVNDLSTDTKKTQRKPTSVKIKPRKQALKVLSRNRGWYVKELDRVFSIFIRQREADKNGMVKCFTCPKTDHWTSMQNSHYYSRRYMSLRFNEKNCHAACMRCNVFMEGNKPAYTLALIQKYGEGVLQELEIKRNNVSKLGIFELKYLISDYEAKNEAINLQK